MLNGQLNDLRRSKETRALPVLEFVIRGSVNRRVTDRGIRAQLYSLSSAFNLRAVALNVRKNVVRVVVKGDENDIHNFYQNVVQYCSRTMGLPRNRVGRISEYGGVEPDWQGFSSSFMLEQLSKGIDYLQSINEQFMDARTRFDRIHKTMTSVEREVRSLPVMTSEVRGLRQEIGKARKLAEKFLKGR